MTLKACPKCSLKISKIDCSEEYYFTICTKHCIADVFELFHDNKVKIIKYDIEDLSGKMVLLCKVCKKRKAYKYKSIHLVEIKEPPK